MSWDAWMKENDTPAVEIRDEGKREEASADEDSLKQPILKRGSSSGGDAMEHTE